MSVDPDAKAPLVRRVLGSALSALVGWLTVNIVIFGFAAAPGTSAPGTSAQELWTGTAIVAVISFGFIFATWLVALVPLYLFVPLNCCLWRWHVCTACGAFSGAVIMYVYSRYGSPQAHCGLPCGLAAITGGVTCLFGSLTSHWFQTSATQNRG